MSAFSDTAVAVPRGPGAGERAACVLALVAGIAFHVAFIAHASFEVDGERFYSLFDDAMISLTYARNLAEGHGLVWMPGEPRVEGYTNPLWTLLMVLPHWAGLPERLVSLPVQALGAVLLAATAWLAMHVARRIGGPRWLGPATVAAVSFCYPLVFWTLRGLEVGLVACLVTAAVLLALRLVERPSARDRAGLAAVLAAMVSTRMDASVFATTLVVLLALATPRTRRDAAWVGGAMLAALGLQTAFRLAYYGELLPNTYHLKMSGHLIGDRLAHGVEALVHTGRCLLWAPLILTLALVAVRRGALRRGETWLVALVASGLAYSTWVGGDAWEWADFVNRYISPVLPLLIVLALLGGAALAAARGAPARLGAGVGLVAFGALALPRLWGFGDGVAVAEVAATALAGAALWLGRWGPLARSRWAEVAVGTLVLLALIAGGNGRSLWDWRVSRGLHVLEDEHRVRQGLALRALTPADIRIAVVDAGAIPYFSHRRAIDLLGKSDPVIARGAPQTAFWPGHDKWNYEHSIGEPRPELVVRLWMPTSADREHMQRWAYEPVGEAWLRRDAALDRSVILRW